MQLQGFAEFNTDDGLRRMFAEAVVAPANRLFIPHIAAEMPDMWWTEAGLAVTAAAGSVTFRSGAGDESPLAGLETADSHAVIDLNVFFGEELGPGEAVGEFSSSLPDLVSVLMCGRRDDFAVASALALKSLPAHHLNFSHVAQDTTWWTGFSIFNTAIDTATVAVTGYNEAVGAHTVSVLPRTKMVAFVNDFIPVQPVPSHVVMESDRPVIGCVLFGGRSAPVMAGINADANTSTTLFYPHVRVSSSEWTGVTMINYGTADASVNIREYDDAGQQVALGEAVLAPMEKRVRFVQDLFGGSVPGNLSHLEVESDQPLAGLELVVDFSLTRLDGLPAFPGAFASVKATAGPAGTLASVGQVEVSLPAGAVPEGNTLVLLEQPLDWRSNGETQPLGPVTCSLEPEGLKTVVPFTICLPIPADVLDQIDAGAIDPAELANHRWNSRLGVWEAIPTSPDKIGTRLSEFVSVFGTYAVVVRARPNYPMTASKKKFEF